MLFWQRLPNFWWDLAWLCCLKKNSPDEDFYCPLSLCRCCFQQWSSALHGRFFIIMITGYSIIFWDDLNREGHVMKKLFYASLILAFILPVTGFAANKGELVVCSWGGIFEKAQRKALFDPFEKETGIKITVTTSPAVPT